MNDIGTIIMTIIEWGIVPLILLGILIHILGGVPEEDAPARIKGSALAGKLAGFIIFVMFIVSQKNRELTFSFNIPTYDFAFIPTIVSMAIGFVSSWFFDIIKNSRVLGIYTLVLVAATSITIYSYLFIHNLRSNIVFVALGLTLGVLLHQIFFPQESKQNKKKK